MPSLIKTKYLRYIAVILLALSIGMLCVVFYVNHYLPHGPKYPTGDYECQYGDRGGSCGEVYAEDMRNLNIPAWAKFIRGGEGMLLLIGLIVAGCFARINANDIHHKNHLCDKNINNS